jgi:electron-transferring-flavoprotein dehydrogenase
MNVPKIKGTHTAMKSGMVAAEAIYEAIQAGQSETAGKNSKNNLSFYEVRVLAL